MQPDFTATRLHKLQKISAPPPEIQSGVLKDLFW
jgi:hypothetical protein